jgi:hypothetical protein
LQLPNPAEHPATLHVPFSHVGDAFAGLQTLSQPPQWSALVFVSVSQPLSGSASHTAVPDAHPTASPSMGTTTFGACLPPTVADTNTSMGASISAFPFDVYVTSKYNEPPDGLVEGSVTGTRIH